VNVSLSMGVAEAEAAERTEKLRTAANTQTGLITIFSMEQDNFDELSKFNAVFGCFHFLLGIDCRAKNSSGSQVRRTLSDKLGSGRRLCRIVV